MFQILIHNTDSVEFFLKMFLIYGAENPTHNHLRFNACIGGFINFKNQCFITKRINFDNHLCFAPCFGLFYFFINVSNDFFTHKNRTNHQAFTTFQSDSRVNFWFVKRKKNFINVGHYCTI